MLQSKVNQRIDQLQRQIEKLKTSVQPSDMMVTELCVLEEKIEDIKFINAQIVELENILDSEKQPPVIQRLKISIESKKELLSGMLQ